MAENNAKTHATLEAAVKHGSMFAVPEIDKAKISLDAATKCGGLFAATAQNRFYNLYYDKKNQWKKDDMHGACLDYILDHSSDFDAGDKYILREKEVFARYMRMRVYRELK